MIPGHITCLILIRAINYDLTCFTDPFTLRIWFAICRVLVNTHQPPITLAQIVPCSPTGLPLCSGTDGAAATDTCRDTTFTLELQRPAGGAVYLLAGGAVKSLKLLGSSRGRFLWPQRPQQGTQKEERPHPGSTQCYPEVRTPASTFYTCRPLG